MKVPIFWRIGKSVHESIESTESQILVCLREMMHYQHISAHPVSGVIGAEISGVDLAITVAPRAVAEIRQALLEYNVVFLRGQELTAEQFLAFAQQLGEPSEYPLLPGLPGYPMITPVVKRENETQNFGGVWHSDTTYLPQPPMATLLLARTVPAVGGDTLFTNMYAAYDTLSDGMKHMLSGLIGVSSSRKADAMRTREDRVSEAGRPNSDAELIGEHPVVRTHPETGRKALYLNIAHTVKFVGMTEEESAPILHYLHQHSVRPEFTCRFSWTVGSMAIWDNRCTMHNPVNDYHGYLRKMDRITLRGDTPR
jgi:taurine dioxygenase